MYGARAVLMRLDRRVLHPGLLSALYLGYITSTQLEVLFLLNDSDIDS